MLIKNMDDMFNIFQLHQKIANKTKFLKWNLLYFEKS